MMPKTSLIRRGPGGFRTQRDARISQVRLFTSAPCVMCGQTCQTTDAILPHRSETRKLPYTAQQMYDLVADVSRYPEFLPWNSAARIRSRQQRDDGAEVIEADLVISFKVFRERFGSRVTLWPEALKIDTEYLDGPFRHLHSGWAFRDLPDDDPAAPGCEVDFFVDFEFRNALLARLIGVVFDEAMSRIVRAFETRARNLYGAPAAR